MHQDSELIRLRGHHLLCIRSFTGAGYSEEFINNMQRVVDTCNLPSQSIRIVEGSDDICSQCPYNRENSCLKDNEKARQMDEKTLVALGVEKGGVYTVSYLLSQAEKVIQENRLRVICEGCQWFDSHCRFFWGY